MINSPRSSTTPRPIKLIAGVLLSLSYGLCSAGDYNVILKFPDSVDPETFVASTCARGGFTFDKDVSLGAGGFEPNSLSIEVDKDCLADIEEIELAAGSDATVQVLDIADNGLNVAGLNGSAIGASASFAYRLSFNLPPDATAPFDAARTFTLQKIDTLGDDNPDNDVVQASVSGRYHVYNVASVTLDPITGAVPEPTTLALLGGAALCAWATKRRRPRR